MYNAASAPVANGFAVMKAFAAFFLTFQQFTSKKRRFPRNGNAQWIARVWRGGGGGCTRLDEALQGPSLKIKLKYDSEWMCFQTTCDIMISSPDTDSDEAT